MNACPNDQLRFFGYPLVGGNNSLPYFGSLPFFSATTILSPIFFDYFVPFITYTMHGGDLAVTNLLFLHSAAPDSPRHASMIIKDFSAPLVFFGSQLFDDSLQGDMGMIFKGTNPALARFAMMLGFPGGLNMLGPMVDNLFTSAGALSRIAKALEWSAGSDPLILDLDGDGIETIDIGDADLRFDLDGDGFSERTGWLSGDDGFLVRDIDRDGDIEDISEMFGGPGQSGIGALAAFDQNGDGRIDASDAIWSELQIRQDRDGDGETDAGELTSLAAQGIVSLSLDWTAMNHVTPQGTQLDGAAGFTRDDGSIGRMFDAVFEMNDIDTRFDGEAGIASWLGSGSINARGFGEVADLAITVLNLGTDDSERGRFRS